MTTLKAAEEILTSPGNIARLEPFVGQCLPTNEHIDTGVAVDQIVSEVMTSQDSRP
jgi:hypothetical protein